MHIDTPGYGAFEKIDRGSRKEEAELVGRELPLGVLDVDEFEVLPYLLTRCILIAASSLSFPCVTRQPSRAIASKSVHVLHSPRPKAKVEVWLINQHKELDYQAWEYSIKPAIYTLPWVSGRKPGEGEGARAMWKHMARSD